MAFESTAINDLVAGLQQRPLARESDDWLFGEGDDATQIDPRAGEPEPEFDPMRAVTLPRPFAQMQVPMPVEPMRHPSATTHVRSFDWIAVAKKLVLPAMLISIVSVAFGIYFAVTDETPSTNAVAAVVDETPTPVEKAIELPVAHAAEAPAAKAAEPALERVELTAVVTPIEAPTEAPSEQPSEQPSEPPSEQRIGQPTDRPTEVPAPTAIEKVDVPPGSPASRFLAPPPVETTIKAIEKPAPAPTTVPDLAPVPTPSREKPAPVAKPPAVVKAAKVAKTTARAERATKPVARKNVRAPKARTRKRAVATAPAPVAVASGKGVLSIASTPAMQVWVDGRNSKAMTPVRIKLLAGTHEVTLVDKQSGKARSFQTEIRSDETTTVTKNYQ